eukprot:1149826-Pelagomonas_calceolata.AAC.2
MSVAAIAASGALPTVMAPVLLQQAAHVGRPLRCVTSTTTIGFYTKVITFDTVHKRPRQKIWTARPQSLLIECGWWAWMGVGPAAAAAAAAVASVCPVLACQPWFGLAAAAVAAAAAAVGAGVSFGLPWVLGQ